jgi:metal-responsive CopG/Arc/MetJ family transcriptional regulator
VAKVMISIPDKLLERIDAHVEAAHETRSGFLRRMAEKGLDDSESHRRKEVERLLDQIEPFDAEGPSVVQLIREDRNSR